MMVDESEEQSLRVCILPCAPAMGQCEKALGSSAARQPDKDDDNARSALDFGDAPCSVASPAQPQGWHDNPAHSRVLGGKGREDGEGTGDDRRRPPDHRGTAPME